MLKDYVNYIGSSQSDNWIKILDDYAMSRLEGQLPPHSVPWGVRPDDVKIKENLCVKILAENPLVNDLPTFVKESSNVSYIDIPLRFVPFLKPDSISSSVKMLIPMKLKVKFEEDECVIPCE